MKFEKESVTLEKGEVYNSVLRFTPEDISYTGAIYYTSDATIASVTNEGVITARSAGSCTIRGMLRKRLPPCGYYGGDCHRFIRYNRSDDRSRNIRDRTCTGYRNRSARFFKACSDAGVYRLAQKGSDRRHNLL